MYKIQKIFFLLCQPIIYLLFVPSLAFGIGLGKLQVNSNLGEALNLELHLISVTPADIGSMSVGLASRSDFAQANVEYPESAGLLNFNIVEEGGGQYFIMITSDNFVNDTFLHFLVSVEWSGGKVVREYTALLDPPLYSGESTAVVVNVPSATEEISSSDISTTTDPISTDSSSNAFINEAGSTTLLVQRGDTLSNIVSSLGKPGSVSMLQGLTAILNANPNAFIDGNMNRLIAGVRLNIPSFADMANIDPQIAQNNFENQVYDYNQFLVEIGWPTLDGSNKVTSNGEDISNELTEELSGQVSSELNSGSVEPIEADPEVVLSETEISLESEQSNEIRLSIGQETGDEELASAISGSEGNAAQIDALKTQLAELDESLLASGVESEEVKQRLEDIQSQVERVSNLLEIEDTNLAVSEDRAATDDEVVLDEVAPISNDDETASIETNTTPKISGNAVTTQDSESIETLAAVTDESTAQTATKTDVQPEVLEEIEEVEEDSSLTRNVVQTSIMDTFVGLLGSFSDYALKVVAALIALIAALFFYRRRKSQREFEESILDIESEQISANTEQRSFKQLSTSSGIDLASNDSKLGLTIGGGMSYLSEEGIAGVAEEENEVMQAGAVDPMDEAGVYLAYDRDEQAIQVLKEAYTTNPERTELAEKLLEIYHKQDDRKAFDLLATDLRSHLGAAQYPVWVKIAAMGKEVSPDNDLYSELSELTDLLPDQDIVRSQVTPTIDVSSINDVTDLTLDYAEEDLGSEHSDEIALKTLELENPGLSLEDDKAGVDLALDASTLSQIVATDEKDNKLIHENDEDDHQSIDLEIEEIDDSEIEFSLGNDDGGSDLDEDDVSDLVNALSVLNSQQPDDSRPNQRPNADAGIDTTEEQDSYLTDASEQSISDLAPYHEAETALELAKAYLELGEKDIAKGFIEEVINEGNMKQKAKAQKLVKELVD